VEDDTPQARAVGSEDVSGFYDTVADDYHLAVHQRDWSEVVEEQGERLQAILGTRLAKPPPWRVLDCSCGIGTQAIGLALRDHHVVGTDLSPGAVERARREAALFGVASTFAVADMCRLHLEVEGKFDAVISCGNSLAHLGGNELAAALESISSKLVPNGVALVSIRDYDALGETRPRVPSLPQVHDSPAGRRVIFQIWDWEPDGRSYSMTWIFLREDEGGFGASHVTTRLHAHRRAELAKAAESVGFVAPEWHLAHEEPCFDPVLTALWL
jgi:glycine/sarcosine N-methyltransferase